MKKKANNENIIEGRNAVLEAFRSGKPIDKLFVLDGCQDGPIRTIVREPKSMIPFFSSSPKKGCPRYPRREDIRELSPMRQPTSTRTWRICLD